MFEKRKAEEQVSIPRRPSEKMKPRKGFISPDKVVGMLVGHHLGDALGAPHEFMSPEYTGFLKDEVYGPTSQYHERKVLPVGSTTDDTAMTQAMLRSMIKENGYDADKVIMSYMNWANGWSRGMGRNTRKMLKGIKTVQGFNKRWEKEFKKKPKETWTKSNGSLMRACPLALIDRPPISPAREGTACTDCRITNPHEINIDCNRVYVTILWMLIRNYGKDEIKECITSMVICDEVRQVMAEAMSKISRKTNQNRGWVLHSFYYAMKAFYHGKSYLEVVDVLACSKGDDTDTNAAIAGGIMGAMFGFKLLTMDEITRSNIKVMNEANNFYPWDDLVSILATM